MSKYAQSIYRIMVLLGIDPRMTINTCKGLPGYFRDLWNLKSQAKLSTHRFHFGIPRPCLEDRGSESGNAKGHYFHQDLLVARRIFINNPEIHVDVGSRIDGLVAHVASFRKIEVFDIRKQTAVIPNVSFVRVDLMGDVDENLRDYSDSISCLHALEHFGLGRYGDPVRHDGYLDGLNNLRGILKKNGKIYISVPIGPQRIEFNAHRVFSLVYLLELFHGAYRVDRFSYVDDAGNLHEEIPLTHDGIRDNFGCYFGCGIFEMTKL